MEEFIVNNIGSAGHLIREEDFQPILISGARHPHMGGGMGKKWQKMAKSGKKWQKVAKSGEKVAKSGKK